MLFYEKQCIGCMACFPLCDKGAHRIERHPENNVHKMDLTLCQNCPKLEICAESCPSQALRSCGREMEAGELLNEVLKDRDFYGQEGGVTCSGGEPLLQDEFLLEFLPLCREHGISTCVDTTLNVEWKRIEKLLPSIDLFLVDIKFMDDALHRQYTGVSGKPTIENLCRISDAGKPVILRMPLAAGVNDTDKEIAERKAFLEILSNIQRVDCFAVTGHGAAKYQALQKEMNLFNQHADLQTAAEKMQTSMDQAISRKGTI